MATTEPCLSLETSTGAAPAMDPGKCSPALCSSSQDDNNGSWVIDSGASDHMTFDAKDFAHTSPPPRTCIVNANVDDLSVGRAHHMHHPVDDKKRQIWLWHLRLGHLSFGYMKHLFPDLFSSMSFFDLKCETYILAKSYRATYPLSMNKSNVPFALIHSDVWGPSLVSTPSGSR